MDPDANVREQWEIVRAAEQAHADGTNIDALVTRLYELRDALRAWRASGGFAPTIKPPTAVQVARLLDRS